MGSTRVLVVDDDPESLAALVKTLGRVAIGTASARGETEAMKLLKARPEAFDVLLLDLAGGASLPLLLRLKADPRFKHIPVILQTASNSPEEIAEGLRLGAYYYLPKPWTQRLLQAVVRTAAEDCARHKLLQRQGERAGSAVGLLQEGRFAFRTLAECHALSNALGKLCPDPAMAVTGISELLINALEHGNLGITYQEKTELLDHNRWRTEVNRRQQLPEHVHKQVRVHVQRLADRIRFEIQDEGPGFQWEPYVVPSPARVFDNHGRGIFMAKLESFDRLEYLGTGSQVVAEVLLPPLEPAPAPAHL